MSGARATFFTGQDRYMGRGEIVDFGVNEDGGGIFWVDISVRFITYAQGDGLAKIVITSSPRVPETFIKDGLNSLTMRPDRTLEVRLGDIIHLTAPVSELFG